MRVRFVNGVIQPVLDVIFAILTDPPSALRILGSETPIGQSEFDQLLDDWTKPRGLLFGIQLLETSEIIGFFAFDSLNRRTGVSHIQLGMLKKYQNKGLMSEAVEMGKKIFFNHEKGYKLFCKVYKFNKPSQKLCLGAGCQFDATLKEADYVDGEYEDVLVYSINKFQYRDIIKEKLNPAKKEADNGRNEDVHGLLKIQVVEEGAT